MQTIHYYYIIDMYNFVVVVFYQKHLGNFYFRKEISAHIN